MMKTFISLYKPMNVQWREEALVKTMLGTYQCSFFSYNKCPTLLQDTDNGGGVHVWGQGEHRKYLCPPLNFYVDLKLFLKKTIVSHTCNPSRRVKASLSYIVKCCLQSGQRTYSCWLWEVAPEQEPDYWGTHSWDEGTFSEWHTS
jgi:hypothetical protein